MTVKMDISAILQHFANTKYGVNEVYKHRSRYRPDSNDVGICAIVDGTDYGVPEYIEKEVVKEWLFANKALFKRIRLKPEIRAELSNGLTFIYLPRSRAKQRGRYYRDIVQLAPLTYIKAMRRKEEENGCNN